MRPIKNRLLTTTMVPLAVAAGVAVAIATPATRVTAGQTIAANPCNPCAAKRNPCAAKNPCNPCAAKANPCAAKNPCNPCAGGATAFSSKCVVPRLVAAARNPCAAKRNPCNPCAAKANPCAAKANPCAAKANPCNPCGAAAEVRLTPAEATAVYDCLRSESRTAYARSGNLWAKWYLKWKNVAKRPYVSATHGQRYVNNYASKKAAGSYSKFEKGGKLPRGGVLAKDSFMVTPQGRVSLGPLFLMEKMGGGFNRAGGGWRYTMIMPDGRTAGTTGGKGSANVKFCQACHAAVAQNQDWMFFLPEDVRRM